MSQVKVSDAVAIVPPRMMVSNVMLLFLIAPF
jgi:hypothetical protein